MPLPSRVLSAKRAIIIGYRLASVRPWRQSVTAALQELNDRIRPTNEDFAQWFAGIGYKEINPARLERFFSVLVWRIPAAQNALQATGRN